MPRIQPKHLPQKERNPHLAILWEALASLSTTQEVHLFLQGLLSEGEEVMLARRIIIAKELLAEKSYTDIATSHHVGYSTIAKIHAWLSRGMTEMEQFKQKNKKKCSEKTEKR